jgi:hypothetical protein
MARKRSDFERETDLQLIAKLYLQGWTQERIAGHIAEIRDYELSQPTISNDLALIQWRWRDNTSMSLDAHKANELARIDLLEREYWEQYELSKKDYKSKTVKKSFDDSKLNELIIKTEERTGNPAYLQGIERCIKLRMDLLGLYAPKEVRIEIMSRLVTLLIKANVDPDEFFQKTSERLESGQ